MAAALKGAEVGAAGLVEHHHLAVDHHPAEGEPGEGPRQLGEGGDAVAPALPEEARLALLAAGDRAVPLVLELEDPAWPREGSRAALGEHHLDRRRRDLPPRRAEGRELAPDLLAAAGAVAQ